MCCSTVALQHSDVIVSTAGGPYATLHRHTCFAQEDLWQSIGPASKPRASVALLTAAHGADAGQLCHRGVCCIALQARPGAHNEERAYMRRWHPLQRADAQFKVHDSICNTVFKSS
jgi:hypothetical protein